MPLLLHRAPRADALADGLAALLAEPPEDPFAPELVIVPARGVERWLSQRLSHRVGAAPGREDGLCAGVELRSPASLVGEVLGTTEDDPWSPDALVWPLLQVVDEAAGEPWCQTLSLHLGHEHEGEERELRRGRRYATARRLARHLAAYAVQRPSLLTDWEAGRDTDGAEGVLDPDLTWQPELWRRLVARVGAPSPVVRHREVCDALGSGELDPDLPARLSLFGHTRLPVTEVRLLAALGERREVHLWLPHPSPASWAALTDLTGSVARDDDPARRRVHHPLLASLGRDLRELQRSLQEVGPLDVTSATEDPAGPGETTLLGWLQADLAADRSPDEAGLDRVLRGDDRSVQVHACHGPARQVEVLREVLLGLLADDPTLEPRDVVVMCPDIEAYAPLVSAAFGMGEIGSHPGHRLRVRLADRSLTQTNPLLAVVERLLDLAGGRAEASVVLDLLATEPVRRRFGLTESDLETLTDWVEKAGVRWAFDGEHRRDFGLERFVQNTWRFGIDRVLTGVAVSDDADRYFGATLPLDDVGSTSIDLAGRLAEALDRVQRLAGALTGSHPVDHWLTTIGRAVEELTLVPRGEEWQTAQVHRELAQVLDASARSWAGDLELRLPDVRSLMAERLAGRPTRANFRTGTLTVATMVPMRSVPHRVVCLLGLDDGSFPRVGAVDGDDVLARRPLTGERDVRSEDRQLMLDAVVAATEHLVVTYTGAHETTGAPRPPAVPLGELLDAVELTVPGGRDHVLRSHPLQAFDQDNLVPPRPFSFDGAALAGARAAARPREAPPALAGAVLPRPGGDVELAELSAFLRHPVRHFLRRRLEVALPDEGEEVTDGLPVDLDGLQQWQVGERLLADLLLGRTPGQARDREWRRGVLPPGRLGWDLAKRLADQALPVAELVDSVTQGQRATARDVDVDLGDGRRLRGTVTGIHGTRVVRHSYSRLGPRHYLDAWVPLLALCADSPGRGWTAGSVGRGRFRSQPTARAAFAPVEEATVRLRELVAIYDAGTAAPLPLPLRTGHAWAANPRAARPKAEAEWSRARFGPECEDEAHVRVWGADAPLARLLEQRPLSGEEREGQTTRLGALATTLWRPVLDRARS
ncbi:exodeoxyribonuclease V subunit gamma [Marmoricola sp. Leaf446]|uniref:exodeoxyribonuclease V subunit gamma n=1 Tax=Marmoricola sp. Leaf446 TaxID=1736379 RepID=UPI0007004878|nr:exodeoxyribonuclease V subunit gamma [Marmoricola sp. Leaf446]KQT92031.1 exodeoxyribonuclease V subunit gamma [Marmoricola sp. Leaf446]